MGKHPKALKRTLKRQKGKCPHCESSFLKLRLDGSFDHKYSKGGKKYMPRQPSITPPITCHEEKQHTGCCWHNKSYGTKTTAKTPKPECGKRGMHDKAPNSLRSRRGESPVLKTNGFRGTR